MSTVRFVIYNLFSGPSKLFLIPYLYHTSPTATCVLHQERLTDWRMTQCVGETRHALQKV